MLAAATTTIADQNPDQKLMTKIINIETTTYRLSELLAMVRSGDEIIVQEANLPPVKLILAESRNSRQTNTLVLGLFEGMGHIPDDFNDELPIEFWLGEDA